MISSERASQEEQNGANFRSVAPSSDFEVIVKQVLQCNSTSEIIMCRPKLLIRFT